MTTWRARRRRVLDWLADDDHGLPALEAYAIADVLRDRDGYERFARLLDGASELCFYAPSGVNVLPQHLPDVKRWVQGGGRARIVVHDSQAASVGGVRAQLDTNTDFLQDLERSLTALARHAEPGTDGRVPLSRVPADRTDEPEARPQ